MIVNYSDVHAVVACMVAGKFNYNTLIFPARDIDAESPNKPIDILMEIASAVLHMCDQYGIDKKEFMLDAEAFYEKQIKRDLDALE